MTAATKLTLSIPQKVWEQAEAVARQLDISPNELFELAIEHFIEGYPDHIEPDSSKKITETELISRQPERMPVHEANAPASPIEEQTVINQGDVFWIRPENPGGTNLGFYPHPYVVVQDNIFNHSRIDSVVVCALTTNLKQAKAPGNVLLEVTEANLPQQSAVVISKISAVKKSQLSEYIGSLDEQRIKQILAGIRFLQSSFFPR